MPLQLLLTLLFSILLLLMLLLTISRPQQLLEILLTIDPESDENVYRQILYPSSAHLKYSTTILVALTMLSTTCLLWPAICPKNAVLT